MRCSRVSFHPVGFGFWNAAHLLGPRFHFVCQARSAARRCTSSSQPDGDEVLSEAQGPRREVRSQPTGRPTHQPPHFSYRDAGQNLWRRIEKDAENLLREVDETESIFANGRERLYFSTLITKSRRKPSAPSEGAQKTCDGFHTFTRLITTTRFIRLALE